jgi:hypothetical protein
MPCAHNEFNVLDLLKSFLTGVLSVSVVVLSTSVDFFVDVHQKNNVNIKRSNNLNATIFSLSSSLNLFSVIL